MEIKFVKSNNATTKKSEDAMKKLAETLIRWARQDGILHKGEFD